MPVVIPLHWLVLSAFVLVTLLYLVVQPRVKEMLYRRRKRKAAEVLRHELAHRARETQLQQELADAKKEQESLLEEVERLTRRCAFQANELRCDQGAKTQVLPPHLFGRFSKK